MIDMASPAREQIYSVVRTFTCATVAEADAATREIIRLVDNSLPSYEGGVKCSDRIDFVFPVVARIYAASVRDIHMNNAGKVVIGLADGSELVVENSIASVRADVLAALLLSPTRE